MIKFSDNINEISTAIAKAQSEIENANKNAANPHFRSKYADLAEVLNVVRPVYSKHGIAITQHPSYTDNIVYVTTLMSHTSGQWIQSCYSCMASKADAQGVMAATTYLRRGSLASIAGIGQADDDGETAVGRGKTCMEVLAKAQNVKIGDVLDPAIVKSLQTAKDLKALATAWGKIDVAVRHDYSHLKDECKAKLSEPANG